MKSLGVCRGEPCIVPQMDFRIAVDGFVRNAIDGLQRRAPQIGVAASIRPNAEGVVGANSQTLSAGSELYANETVRTGNRRPSGPGVYRQHQFDCWTHVRGPARQVRVRSDGSSGRVVLQATRGAFRFVTGSQDHRAYQLNTPYGTAAPARSHSQVLPACCWTRRYAALDPAGSETVTFAASSRKW